MITNPADSAVALRSVREHFEQIGRTAIDGRFRWTVFREAGYLFSQGRGVYLYQPTFSLYFPLWRMQDQPPRLCVPVVVKLLFSEPMRAVPPVSSRALATQSPILNV